MSDTAPVLAFQKWEDNGHLIAAQAEVFGNLRADWTTLDPTYGYGTFWNVWRPDVLVRQDIDPAKAPDGVVDFTALPYADESFDAVVFDPPYKLNGTPTDVGGMDERFGVADSTDWRVRMTLIRAGARECGRVAKRMLLVKCQDQVVCSVIRWQTKAVAEEVEPLGFGLKHRFDFYSYRKQPSKRRQRNPRSVSSQLLVFQRGWEWR